MNAQNLNDNPQEREALFIKLYKKAFPKIARYIARRGGTLEDAGDIFQDGVIIYYEKAVAGFVCQNEQAYLMGVAKRLWLKKVAQYNAQPLGNELSDIYVAPEPVQLLTDRLLAYVETAGQKCMRLLKAFYYDRVPVNEIANRFGYSGVRSATVQKYKCLEKIRETVKQKALHYEDFVA